jgi:hypothetical protein
VDDFTGYSTFDVIHKVRCEAKEAVNAYYHEHNFSTRQGELDRLLIKIEVLKTAYDPLAKKLRREREMFAAREQEWERLEVKKAELVRLVQALDKYLLDLKAQIERQQSSEQPSTRVLIDRTADRVTEVIEESRLVARLIEEMKKERAPFEQLIGNEAEALKNLAAEQNKLKESRLAELATFNRTTIAMQFQFEITENDNASGSASATWPVHLGTFSLNLNAGAKKIRVSDRNVKVTVNFEDLQTKVDCSGLDLSDKSRRAHKYPITGNIGLREFMEQYFLISDASAIDSTEKSFLETLKFTTTINKGIKPSVKLAPVNPSAVTADLDFSADRKDYHVVTVGVSRSNSKADSIADKASAIIVSGLPEVNLRVARDPLDAYFRGNRSLYRP